MFCIKNDHKKQLHNYFKKYFSNEFTMLPYNFEYFISWSSGYCVEPKYEYDYP